MDIASFQMDLLRLGSALAQQEQTQAAALPALVESIDRLGSLESTEELVVRSGSRP